MELRGAATCLQCEVRCRSNRSLFECALGVRLVGYGYSEGFQAHVARAHDILAKGGVLFGRFVCCMVTGGANWGAKFGPRATAASPLN